VPPAAVDELSSTESSFLAGILKHLPALCALTLPTAASYARVVDGAWTGGTYAAWGVDTRETPVRACGARVPGKRHFEFRPLDGTANPHIALAAVLGAGVRAIAENTVLDIHSCGQVPPAEMAEAERKQLGIHDRLPRSLGEARARLHQDAVVMDILGGIGEVWAGVNEVSQLRTFRFLVLIAIE
jgi:glutamine synthetase